MHIITRRLEFDAGHRVFGHEGKCAHIHGHRYVVEVSCSAFSLDHIGRVIDFSKIKEICGRWIDENLDHGMLLWSGDPLVQLWESGFTLELQGGMITNEKHKFFKMETNPTAENIAEMLYALFGDMLKGEGIQVVKVTVWETPNCSAVYVR